MQFHAFLHESNLSHHVAQAKWRGSSTPEQFETLILGVVTGNHSTAGAQERFSRCPLHCYLRVVAIFWGPHENEFLRYCSYLRPELHACALNKAARLECLPICDGVIKANISELILFNLKYFLSHILYLVYSFHSLYSYPSTTITSIATCFLFLLRKEQDSNR